MYKIKLVHPSVNQVDIQLVSPFATTLNMTTEIHDKEEQGC